MGTPSGVCPVAFWVMLRSIMGYGYPPRCGQTENITFPILRMRKVISDIHERKFCCIVEIITIILQIAIYLKPFKLNVWLLILATIPFCALAVFAIVRLSPVLLRKQQRTDFGLFEDSILFSFGALFAQGRWYFGLKFFALNRLAVVWRTQYFKISVEVTARFISQLIGNYTTKMAQVSIEMNGYLCFSQICLGKTYWNNAHYFRCQNVSATDKFIWRNQNSSSFDFYLYLVSLKFHSLLATGIHRNRPQWML